MALSPDLVGVRLATSTTDWTSRDCIIYALGIGAGQMDPASELAFTTDNSAAHPQRVYPTFAVVPSADCGIRAALDLLGDDVDIRQMLHAGQSCEQVEPLPVEGSVVTSGFISAIWDKQRATVVETQTEITAAADGKLLARCQQTLFFRGVGGWGGARGPSATRSSVKEPPDRVLTAATRPDQPLLYRLSGDDNPLHTDPAVAAAAGFKRPIMHGMCTFGIAGRLLLNAFGDGDTTRFKSLAGRFNTPATPGDTLTIAAWDTGAELYFTVSNEKGDLLMSDGSFTMEV